MSLVVVVFSIGVCQEFAYPMSELIVARSHLDAALSLIIVGVGDLDLDDPLFVEARSIVGQVEFLRARLGDLIGVTDLGEY